VFTSVALWRTLPSGEREIFIAGEHSIRYLRKGTDLKPVVEVTRQTPSYLSDYAYDAATREVVLLEVVKRAGLFGTGKTVITINKLD
jgi:hypothetical protein